MKLRKPSTEKFKKCLAYKGPKKWNQLSKEFHFVPSKHQFKALIKTWVSNKAAVSETSGEIFTEVV